MGRAACAGCTPASSLREAGEEIPGGMLAAIRVPADIVRYPGCHACGWHRGGMSGRPQLGGRNGPLTAKERREARAVLARLDVCRPPRTQASESWNGHARGLILVTPCATPT